MPAPSADSQGAVDQESQEKPSLRKRLFSTGRKGSKKGKQTGDEVAHGVDPPSDVQASNDTEAPLASTANEGQVPTPQSVSAKVPAVPGSASTPGSADPQVPGAGKDKDKDDKDKEGERERGSANTTLIGTHKQSPFYRRKVNKSTASEGAVSSSTSHSIVKPKAPTTTRPKPSFFSKIVHRLVPCVGPSPKTHAIELEKTASIASDTKAPMALKEMSDPQETEEDPPSASQTNADASSSAPLVAPSISIDPPPSPTDSDIIVQPPASTHLLPEDETDGLTSGAVQPPGSTGDQITRSHTHDSVDDSEGTYTDEEMDVHDEQAEEERLIRNGGSGVPIGPDGIPKPLLPPIAPEHAGRKCLVLDLDETLVHSSFKAIQQADFIVPVEIEYHWHHFHVLKRPGVDNFLKKMGEIYEVVVFTASLSKYADPVLDKLDIHQVVTHRLFRESCYSHKGNYVKDLSQLGRPIADTIILDNSPASYIFHPTNAVPVSSWFNDPHDAELTDLIPFLADLTAVSDVRGILDGAL